MQDNDSLAARLNRQTATIKWSELQPFFARGQAVRVETGLDLIEVAAAFADDQVEQVKRWMQDNRVAAVSEQEAADWASDDAVVWAVVVAPWVLVQERLSH